MIPVIGLGSSANFATVARAEDASALEAVFQTMADLGARAFDTAPSYGASEQVAGAIVNELGIEYKMFAIFKQPKIDLMQVHNLGDPASQFPNVREFKKAGRVRYVGITTTWAPFFLEFTLTHPAITAVTPATSQAKNMLDNIGGGIGRLPTAAHRHQIIELVDALPALPRR